MPPKRKFVKHKDAIGKKQITTRLMAISLLVDKYIYKNKQITISQAQMYLEELTSLKPRCLNDAPSLQVCEKLTRCMRGVIEEQSHNIPSQDIEVFDRPNYPYATSPVYSLPDEDKMYTETEVVTHNEQANHSSYINTGSSSEGNNDTKRVKKFVRFNMDLDITNTECLKTDDHSDFNNKRSQNPYTETSNVDTELTDIIEDLTLEDNRQQNETGDLCSQSLLKNMDLVEQTTENLLHDTCGQDIAEFDREIVHLIEPESPCLVEHSKNSAVQKSDPTLIVQNTLSLLQTDVWNTPEMIGKQTSNTINETLNIQPKKKVKTNRTITKKKNKENTTVNKRKIKKSDSKLTKNNLNKPALNPLTNYFQKAQVSGTEEQINGDQMGVTFVPNVVEKHVTNQFTGINTSSKNGSRKKIACFEEDLSWVENIKYVREIQLEEYDTGLKLLSESFWDNCEVPGNWDSRDFELF